MEKINVRLIIVANLSGKVVKSEIYRTYFYLTGHVETNHKELTDEQAFYLYTEMMKDNATRHSYNYNNGDVATIVEINQIYT